MKITMYPYSKSLGIELNERELKQLNTTGKIVIDNDEITFLKRDYSKIDDGDSQVHTFWSDKVSGELRVNTGDIEYVFDRLAISSADKEHNRIKSNL